MTRANAGWDGLRVTPESFATLRPEWDALLPRAVTPLPFVSAAWTEAWWHAFSDDAELLLLAVRGRDDALLGVAPLMIERTEELGRAVRFLGGVDVTDYLDLVARREDVDAVWHAVLDHLLHARARWDTLDFHCLPDWSPSRGAIMHRLADALPVAAAQEEVCPVIALDGSYEAYLKGLPKKERHEIRRKGRNLERDAPGTQPRIITERDEALAALPDFFRLHRLSAPDKERFLTRQVERFFTGMTGAMADAGWLRLYALTIDGAPVAMLYTLRADGRLLVYNSGFDPAYARMGAGMVLTAMMIADAADDGVAICDFLRGNESYKYRFGAVDTPLWRVLAGDDARAIAMAIERMAEWLATPADVRDLEQGEVVAAGVDG